MFADVVVQILRHLVGQVCVDCGFELTGADDLALLHGNAAQQGDDNLLQIAADHLLGA